MFWSPYIHFCLLPKMIQNQMITHLKAQIELFESRKKLHMASFWGWPHSSNWKSNTFTKTCLEPLMTDLLPILKTVFIYPYSRLSFKVYQLAQKWQAIKFWRENWNITDKTIWPLFLFLIGLHIHTVPLYKEEVAINNLPYPRQQRARRLFKNSYFSPQIVT